VIWRQGGAPIAPRRRQAPACCRGSTVVVDSSGIVWAVFLRCGGQAPCRGREAHLDAALPLLSGAKRACGEPDPLLSQRTTLDSADRPSSERCFAGAKRVSRGSWHGRVVVVLCDSELSARRDGRNQAEAAAVAGGPTQRLAARVDQWREMSWHQASCATRRTGRW
jgi:hypothetical protein